jgi:hypothetical protein
MVPPYQNVDPVNSSVTEARNIGGYLSHLSFERRHSAHEIFRLEFTSVLSTSVEVDVSDCMVYGYGRRCKDRRKCPGASYITPSRAIISAASKHGMLDSAERLEVKSKDGEAGPTPRDAGELENETRRDRMGLCA